MRNVIVLLSLLWAGGPLAAKPDGDAVADNAMAIEDACRKLIMSYAYHRDRNDAAAVGRLFTEDATFELFGERFFGREAIEARVAEGAEGPLYRHLVSTVYIDVVNAFRARGVSYATIYTTEETLPASVMLPRAVGEYHDVFTWVDGRWQIHQRTFVPVLLAPPP